MPQEMTEDQRRALEEKIKNMSPEELKEFQKQQCIFCQIIEGKIPSKKVYDDDKCFAVMDINPAAVGHVLLLPKEHYAIMPQVPDEIIGHLFMIAKHISQAMLRQLKVEGTNVFVANGMIAGQKAQHFMIHIIPRQEGDDLLEIKEHLVDEATKSKLAEVIGNKVYDLMGIKKERINVEEVEVGDSEEEHEEVEEEVEKEEKEKEKEGESEIEREEGSEDDEEIKDEKESDEIEEDSDEEGEDNSEEEEKEDGGTNLDDIAKLFS